MADVLVCPRCVSDPRPVPPPRGARSPEPSLSSRPQSTPRRAGLCLGPVLRLLIWGSSGPTHSRSVGFARRRPCLSWRCCPRGRAVVSLCRRGLRQKIPFRVSRTSWRGQFPSSCHALVSWKYAIGDKCQTVPASSTQSCPWRGPGGKRRKMEKQEEPVGVLVATVAAGPPGKQTHPGKHLPPLPPSCECGARGTPGKAQRSLANSRRRWLTARGRSRRLPWNMLLCISKPFRPRSWRRRESAQQG